LSRIKAIAKQDEDIKLITKDSVLLLEKAVVLS